VIALGYAPHARTLVLALYDHFLGWRLIHLIRRIGHGGWRRRIGRHGLNLDNLDREGSANCCNNGARRDRPLRYDVIRSALEAPL
jgi:hypothetical protein